MEPFYDPVNMMFTHLHGHGHNIVHIFERAAHDAFGDDPEQLCIFMGLIGSLATLITGAFAALVIKEWAVLQPMSDLIAALTTFNLGCCGVIDYIAIQECKKAHGPKFTELLYVEDFTFYIN